MRLASLTLLLLLLSSAAQALSCVAPRSERKYVQASFHESVNVFSAYVEGLEKGMYHGREIQLARLRVLQVWKGSLEPGAIAMTTAEDTVNLISDGMVPAAHTGVLVFVGAAQPFLLSSCSPNTTLDHGTKYLPLLNRLSKKREFRLGG